MCEISITWTENSYLKTFSYEQVAPERPKGFNFEDFNNHLKTATIFMRPNETQVIGYSIKSGGKVFHSKYYLKSDSKPDFKEYLIEKFKSYSQDDNCSLSEHAEFFWQRLAKE